MTIRHEDMNEIRRYEVDLFNDYTERRYLDMKPTIGRIVHYTSLGDSEGKFPSEVKAAIVTAVNKDGLPSLLVF